MARTKKKYGNGSSRGGTPGKPTPTAHGAPKNENRTKKNYAKVAMAAGFR